MAKKAPPKKSGGGSFLVAALIVFLVIHFHLLGGAIGGNLNCRHLEHLWLRAGGSSSSELYAANVAMAESSGEDIENTTAQCAPGSNAIGYWQICMPLNAKYVPGGNAYDGLANAEAAVTLSNDGRNWGPWPDSFTSGQTPGQCG